MGKDAGGMQEGLPFGEAWSSSYQVCPEPKDSVSSSSPVFGSMQSKPYYGHGSFDAGP
ncbi:hypothetical protein ASZ90_010270 [hydrocarbon metagenome]|uniref:Uncharacterized protein n=1 Tax=hydrocarbon metagenome TaxID=938273 RepID=A0A0W8FGW4_9ZZZZ